MVLPAPSERLPREPNSIKVWFQFVPRKGWLPYDSEGLWATRLTGDTARVANVPFLQDGVAEGDVVRFITNDEGLHWACERVEASGNCTVRVLPVPDGPLGRSAQAVYEQLTPFGLGAESFSSELPLVAFTVPADAELGQIKTLLMRGQMDGWWHFEESCITDAWRSA
ncbi:DUF4265 domain-containing protein [Nonomuraea sp. 3-1Str]|uniref:DUF4265 domain-containing protein n=1 Tax=Nonomuraea sp. 3-1Str TaxID=2929801 RepID=UPI0028665438|nr:DUF4265 domain-containing protein [Nonomuraea sp. 3-1Str]MDR8407785.1 DUF4265 domain-containing protein [Nonomuraea sp. 3-1Str]